MFTKKLTPTGKIFTKQVEGFISEMASEANPLTIVLYSEKAISEEWMQHLSVEDSSVKLIALRSLIPKIPESVRKSVNSIHAIDTDMSKQVFALFYSHSESYLLIGSRDVIGGSFGDNPQAEEFMSKIIRHVGYLQ